MDPVSTATDTTYRVKKRIAATPQEVFDAWTNPQQLIKWFHVGPDWTTPVCEVDLQPGGQYRLGMKSPEQDSAFVVKGTYQEIKSPEKLVFTWKWEGMDDQETLVTVLFRPVDDDTELELVHERFANSEEREKHGQGWQGCLEELSRALA